MEQVEHVSQVRTPKARYIARVMLPEAILKITISTHVKGSLFFIISRRKSYPFLSIMAG